MIVAHLKNKIREFREFMSSGVTPNIMSPDNLWQSDGKGASYAGTPTEFRRESIRSSLSMMKQKIFGTGAGMGRSCTSIDKQPGKVDKVFRKEKIMCSL